MFTLCSVFQWWIGAKYFCDEWRNSLFEVRKLTMVVWAVNFKKYAKVLLTQEVGARSLRIQSLVETCRDCFPGFYKKAVLFENWHQSCLYKLRFHREPCFEATGTDKIWKYLRKDVWPSMGAFSHFTLKNRCTKRISRLNDLQWRHTLNNVCSGKYLLIFHFL